MRLYTLFFTLISCTVFAKIGTIEVKPDQVVPWFTGPLICPSANVVSVGHYNVEPYVFAIKNPGIYNNDWHTINIPPQWTVRIIAPFWVGLTEWCDVTIIPSMNWNDKQDGGVAWTQGDLIAQIDFQLHHDELPHKNWLPSIKLHLRETIPTGKYRNLDPRKLYADLGGGGTLASQAALVFGKILHFSGYHFLNIRLAAQYTFYNSIVHVKGYNAYGGGVGANGRVRPGQDFTLDLAFEYAVSRNWALALDLVGYWLASAKFTGYPGADFLFGNPTVVAREAAIQYSLAPAIEYNWSENLGVIAGAYFSVAGKQYIEFYSFAFAVNYYK